MHCVKLQSPIQTCIWLKCRWSAQRQRIVLSSCHCELFRDHLEMKHFTSFYIIIIIIVHHFYIVLFYAAEQTYCAHVSCASERVTVPPFSTYFKYPWIKRRRGAKLLCIDWFHVFPSMLPDLLLGIGIPFTIACIKNNGTFQVSQFF